MHDPIGDLERRIQDARERQQQKSSPVDFFVDSKTEDLRYGVAFLVLGCIFWAVVFASGPDVGIGIVFLGMVVFAPFWPIFGILAIIEGLKRE